ncbi:ATP-binding cassette domain-containing protein [Shewanella japonica]|uniref:ATP-binding cassette domain-containing protein n=1 Tax=Shewanella japonica TaxID=93973 RepID=UPI0024952EB1|nr:ATP-binding cassette domain-containing protein [Shewanella japonica]
MVNRHVSVKVSSLSKHFQKPGESNSSKIVALNDISFEVDFGEMIAITGCSGSGKSTLMNLIAGLDSPTAGNVCICGEDISSADPKARARIRNRNVGMIFQSYNLISYLTALENTLLPSHYSSLDLDVCTKKAKALFDAFGLSHIVDHKPDELSGGQQQRVCIIRALTNSPKLIIADEPTGALDNKSRDEVLSVLRKLSNEGHAVIIVTHDNEVKSLCDRSIELQDGIIIRNEINNINKQKKITFITRNDLRKRKVNKVAFYMAFRAVLSKKLQSFLSMLGIIFGIMSIILTVSVGEGAKNDILNSIGKISEDTIKVSTKITEGIKSFDMNDIQELSGIDNINQISPVLRLSQVLLGSNVDIYGINKEYLNIVKIKLVSGRNITDLHYSEGGQVLLISQSFAKANNIDLLRHNNIYLKLGKSVFEVIGIVEDNNSMFYQNKAIYLPYKSIKELVVGDVPLNEIIVNVNIKDLLEDTQLKVKDYFKQKYFGEDFNIESDIEMVRMSLETATRLSILIISIALITLTVSGVGIMNVMLSSVNERRPEIGIRLSVGACPSDIMSQFLLESILLTSFSAIIGIILTYFTFILIAWFASNYSIVISYYSIIISSIFSILLGLVFGYLPARQASLLNPSEVLYS